MCSCSVPGDRDNMFNTGGSGYTLNKAALKVLVVDALPVHETTARTSTEDVMVATLFRRFGIFPYDTKDETGGERYMHLSPGFHHDFNKSAPGNMYWYARYSIDIKNGLDHCAARSVAFHYIKGDEQKRLFAIFYHLCPDVGHAAVAAAGNA